MTYDLDVLGAIELTVSVAVVLGSFAFAMGADSRQRLRWAGALGVWFVALVIAAIGDVFRGDNGFGTPLLGATVALPVLGFAVATLVSKRFRSRVSAAPLALLLALHVTRIFGGNFLLLEDAGRLIDPFAVMAGWGDILVGLAALPLAAWVAHAGVTRTTRMAIVAFSLFGAADLLNAVALGVLSEPDSPFRIFAGQDVRTLSTLPWVLVPGLLVPVFLMAHWSALVISSPRVTDQAVPRRNLADAQSPRRPAGGT